MGIKGIYKEIGPGARIAFLRLAVDSVEKRGRPLRLAIDISIWQFQVQAARGGANPAVRTLFYRLVRLLGMPVQPVFVFDGPNKPLFKRNKRSAGPGDSVATAMAKRMIRMFGFCIHDAPGEAEAECALLQQRGVVDAVLSEDVDTLMFGCSRTLRNWSAATPGTSSAVVTHVTMYETERHLPSTAESAAADPPADPAVVPDKVLRVADSGLDRQGMVLVALMSGGDYIPEGVPGCGVKLACEAAKAGFGRSLCRLRRADAAALAQWRATLQHELRSNESRFFRTCHHKLVIPDAFPNLDVLRYYTHPVVSSADVVERVRAELAVPLTPQTAMTSQLSLGLGSDRAAIHFKPVDVLALRAFCAETFDWTCRGGAVKFSGDDNNTLPSDLFPPLVEGISRQRAHASTDDTPEVRVSFVPLTVVGIDLDQEQDDPDADADFGRDGIALNSDDDFDDPLPTQSSLTVASARSLAAAAPYDPAVPKVAWVPRSIVAIGAPGVLQEWDQKQRPKKTAAAAAAATAAAAAAKQPKATQPRARKQAATAASGMPAGALDKFVSVTKSPAKTATAKTVTATATTTASQQRLSASQPAFKPVPNYFDGFSEGSEDDDDDDDDIVLPARSASQCPSAPPPPPTSTQLPRRKNNPWTMTSGASNGPRVTKASSASGGPTTRHTKEAHTLTPVKRAASSKKRAVVETPASSAQTRPSVISLLSSEPPVPVHDHVPVRVDIDSSSPAAAATSSLPASNCSPKPRRRRQQTPLLTSSSPTKQTSIRDFMSSQPRSQPRSPPQPQPAHRNENKSMLILLSDDDDDGGGAAIVDRGRLDDPFLSSSPPSVPVVVNKSKTKTKTKTTTRYVPRRSAVGYFREETGLEDDDCGDEHAPGWRLSEIGVVDLTGHDR